MGEPVGQAAGQAGDEDGRRAALGRNRTFLRRHLEEQLREAGVERGLVAELGGPTKSIAADVEGHDFEFLSLFGVEDDARVRVADITHCPQIESERYDAVMSVSVFEHVRQPWRAAQEIERILKPGGISVQMAPFSYFYHKAPEDYWRFTHAGFEAMFEGLEMVHHEFYGADRRRDNRGGPTNPVDGDGGPQFAVDDLGGWRENWHVLYVGRKPTDGGIALLARRRDQLVLDLMKSQIETGVSAEDAAARVLPVVRTQQAYAALPDLGAGDLVRIWSKRPGGVKVSTYRWSLAAALLQ